MIHIVHLIRRRFPEQGNGIVLFMVGLSLSGLVFGLGLLLLRSASA